MKYGKTVEFSVWGHSAGDGPIGFDRTTGSYSLDEKQLTLEGWSKIDFNWSYKSYAVFFGCNSFSFSKSFFEEQKKKGLGAAGGYDVYSYPSLSHDKLKVPS